MIEKIQQVEDNWQKPWITIAANTRNFFPQNLTGRRYTGGNAFLLLFLCEKFQYQTPVFMTFNQAKEAGISVLKGSKSFPVYYFLFYVYHKETRKKITFEEYKALSREQEQEYNVIPTYKYYSVFNLDQTNFSDVRPEEWEALREKFRGGQAERPRNRRHAGGEKLVLPDTGAARRQGFLFSFSRLYRSAASLAVRRYAELLRNASA
ncbi:ArdC family protein (plasmid) [Phocaeicola vulgatus]|nr:ArdC family protein [Phocaeicola vulgatus]